MTLVDEAATAVSAIVERVAEAARRSGRAPGDVTIVAAVKTVPVERIARIVDAGITDLGENSARDLRDKQAAIGTGPVRPRWHFLGPIQTKQVRYLDRAALIHSLDRETEAEALERRGERSDREWDVLVEVNVAGEGSKQGIDPREVEPLLVRLGHYPRVHARGFMFVAPQVQNPEDVRWAFAEARALRERFEGSGLDELSMGMSDDFEVAIEEGATIVRLGRVLFGSRPAAGREPHSRGN